MDSFLSKLFEGDESSFYARLARDGDDLVRDEDFAECYASGRGRPSIPPSLLMKAVLLQIRDDVSDREAARRAAKDLDWKRALRLEAEDVPFHHTTLSVFRSRLMVNDADGKVLDATVARAVERGLFPKKVLAIADSTGVMGAAAVTDTYELLRQATAKLVEAAGGPKALHPKLRRDARQTVRGKAVIDWADRAARKDELGRLVALARALLKLTADDPGVAEARDLLSRVLDQDIEDGDDGTPQIRQGVAKDRVVSVVDPEMRHGRKSPSKRVDGYKAHVVTDHDTELILDVTTTPANEPDGPELAGMVANAKAAGVPIREVLGDTAYGDGDTRQAVEAAGAKVTAKTMPPSATGKFLKTDFIIDPAGPSATCPAGHTTTATGWSTDGNGRRVQILKFGHRCDACPLRAQCTSNPEGRCVTLNFHEARLQAARAEQARPAIRRKLRRRSLVERKLAELKMHGMGKARYRRGRKVLLQLRLTAALVNTKRLFALQSAIGAPTTA